MNEYEFENTHCYEGAYTPEEVELNKSLYEECIKEEIDLNVIEEYVKNRNIPFPTYKFIGFDEGANYGLSYLNSQLKFSKMVNINLKIDSDIIKTIELLDGIDKNKVAFVYDPENPSYRYSLLLKRLYATVLEVNNEMDFSSLPNGKALFEKLHLSKIL